MLRSFHRSKGAALAFLLALGLAASTASATPPIEVLGSADLQIALRKLSVLGNVLYVAAHPDDENTALLAYLARERLVRTAYLSITRGDGGQNLIGTEKGELIGLLRTQELLAARRIDRAEQFFTRAVDFGFSKGPEETLRIWGKDDVLGDVVRVYRIFRPDVVITRFPTTGEGGHGHHTASALLAVEAFSAAADPTRYPEQIQEGLRPWAPRRLFWNSWRPQAPSNAPTAPTTKDADVSKLLSVDLGTYNALLGKSYTEIAGESRSMHKSQGFGAAERRGSTKNYFELLKGQAAASDLLEGIETSWRRVPKSAAAAATLAKAGREFQPDAPSASLPVLLQALSELHELAAGADREATAFVARKTADLKEVIRSASGLWVEAIAEDYETYPGGEIKVVASALNRSGFPWTLERVAWSAPSTAGKPSSTGLATSTSASLVNNQPFKTDLRIPVPEDAPYSQPYWLNETPALGRFRVAEPALVGLPEAPAPLRVTFTLRAGSQVLSYEVPVVFRWTDPVKGEQYRPIEIAPAVTLTLSDRALVFPNLASKTVQVRVKASAPGVSGNVRLVLPPGWISAPPGSPFSLAKKGEEATFRFQVTPPAEAADGLVLGAEAVAFGKTFERSLVRVDYPHVPIQTVFPKAEARLVRNDIARLGTRVGYVMGAGDEIPAALSQLGYEVTLLSDEDLDNADLSRFDAIVAGIRAYNTRTRLRGAQPRLMKYVENGGTYVVQYNTSHELVTEDLGPYPLKLSRDRVTVEEASVQFLKPDHRLLTTPNRISAADFAGWVQERGLYFPGTWGDAYETVLSTGDPGEGEKPGGLLYARHGKGVFIYTGYAFFRQLPAGIPGAYRLFANLVSARAGHD